MKRKLGPRPHAEGTARSEKTGRRDRRGNNGGENRDRRNFRTNGGAERENPQREGRSKGAGQGAIARKAVRNRQKSSTSKVGKMSDQQTEVDQNLDYFLGELPKLTQTHMGQFALLRHRAIIDYFSSPLDAVKAGKSLYSDGVFSIQQVTDVPIDLGFFTHAGNLGQPQ